METFKKYGNALTKIGEKVFFVAISYASIWFYFAKAQSTDMKYVAVTVGTIAFLFWILPVGGNYVKANWPKKGK